MKEYSTIIQPIMTEKSSVAQASGQYMFLVKKDATKIDIKHAIKALYGADVDSVRTMIAPKKVRMLRGRHPWAKRPVMKKAVVTIKGGKSIDPNKLKGSKEKKETKKTK